MCRAGSLCPLLAAGGAGAAACPSRLGWSRAGELVALQRRAVPLESQHHVLQETLSVHSVAVCLLLFVYKLMHTCVQLPTRHPPAHPYVFGARKCCWVPFSCSNLAPVKPMLFPTCAGQQPAELHAGCRADSSPGEGGTFCPLAAREVQGLRVCPWFCYILQEQTGMHRSGGELHISMLALWKVPCPRPIPSTPVPVLSHPSVVQGPWLLLLAALAVGTSHCQQRAGERGMLCSSLASCRQK